MSTQPTWVAVICCATIALGCRKTPVLPTWMGAGADAAAGELPPRSAGCATRGEPAEPTKTRSFHVQVAGKDRAFSVQVPPSDRGHAPWPVVFFFHGRRPMDRISLPSVAVTGGLAELPSLAAHAIFVAPHGQPFMKDRVYGWDQSCGGTDMQFFDAMLESLMSSFCIDPRAVFAAGHSWGADMVEALACCRGDKIRAISASSGSDIAANPTCAGTKLPAFHLSFGTRDSAYRPSDFEAAVSFFRKVHGCSELTDPLENPRCKSHRGCAQPVITCAYPGLPHRQAPDYAETAWTFFSRFLAPAAPAR